MITEHNQILGSISYVKRGIKKKSEISSPFLVETFKGFPRKTVEGDPHPYGIGFLNHPCTQWASLTLENYRWLCELNISMCKEYTKRYKRSHVGEAITEWYFSHPPEIESSSITPFAQAMPTDLKSSDAVHSYRMYYATHKAYFAKWKNGEPSWWIDYLKIADSSGLISERSQPFVDKILGK
jgi:hypothetical protein